MYCNLHCQQRRMISQRQKRGLQKQIMGSHWWWHSGMLMILVLSIIFISSLSASNIPSSVVSSKTELSQLITIDAYNYNSIEDGNRDTILKVPDDTFRLNHTKSYFYLNSNSSISNILLQCKIKDPQNNFSIDQYKWSKNGNFEPSQEVSTYILELSDDSAAIDIGCYGTDSSSGNVAVAYFHIIGAGQTNDADISSIHQMYLKEMSLLLKSQSTNQEISLVKHVSEGHSTTLVCELSTPSKSEDIGSDTQIDFQFLKNGNSTTNYGDEDQSSPHSISSESMWKRSLTIPSPSFEDSAVYACMATITDPQIINTPITLYSDMLLDVKLKPKIVDFPNKTKIVQNATTSLSLTCVVESSFESVEIFWRLNGSRLDCDSENLCQIEIINSKPSSIKLLSSRLTMRELSSSGNYTCVAENDVGISERTIEVICHSEAPVIVTEVPNEVIKLWNSNVNIPCSASGIPLPKISWWKKDDSEEKAIVNEETNNMSNLSIISLNKDGEGLYECVAKNIYEQTDQRLVSIIGVRPSKLLEGVSETNDVTINGGESYTFDCSVTVDKKIEDEVKRMWYKDNEELGNNHNLLFYNISYGSVFNNQGIYHCVVETPVDKINISWNLMINSAPPKLNSFSDNTYMAMRGKNLTLPCEVLGGVPRPTLEWKKNGSSLVLEGPASNLQLYKVTAEDEGSYTCIATNEYGSEHVQFNLQVLNPTVLQNTPTDLSIESLQTVSFNCMPKLDERMNTDINEVDFQWYKDDVRMQEINPTLMLENVTNETEGNYRCEISTPYDTVTASWKLTVRGEKPFFIASDPHERALEGSNVTLSCQANGLPLPTIKWMKNNLEIDDKRHNQQPLGDLTINNVDVEDEGEYTCIANNIYGEVSSKTNFEVIKKLSKNANTGYNKSAEITANYKESVVLTCDFDSDPRIKDEVKIGWSRIGQNSRMQKSTIQFDELKYQRGDNGALIIHDVSERDMGMYECVFETTLQQVKEQISLTVKGKAPEIITVLQPIYVIEQGTMNIVCRVSGVPEPSISWSINETLINDSPYVTTKTSPDGIVESQINISNIGSNQAGVYKCQASNNYGSRETFSKVYVMKRTSVEISHAGTINAKAGQRLTMPCNYKVDAQNNITNIDWERLTGGNNLDFDRGYDGRVMTITISNIQKRHEGIYKCTLTTQYDSADATIDVKVEAYGPVIIEHSNNQTVFNNDGVLLICNAEGLPPPKISWQLNSTDVVPKVVGEEYKISRVIHSDTGTYTCTAQNEYGTTKKNMFVNVLTLPVIRKEIIIKDGDSIEMPCIDVRGMEGVTYTWKRNNRAIPINMIQPNGSLILDNVVESRDTGTYSCYIDLGKRNKTLETEVKAKTKLVLAEGGYKTAMEGESITFACNKLWKSHDVKRLWKYNEKYLDDSNKRNISKENWKFLELDNLKLSDSGKYSCIASLGDGKRHTITFTLEVIPKPKILKGCESGINDVWVSRVENENRIESESALVSWQIPENLNRSCYQEIRVRWWTNDSDKYYDDPYDLGTNNAVIENLNSNSGYYVQIVLITPQRLEVAGHTRSFVLSELKQMNESSPGELYQNGGFLSYSALIIILVAAFVSATFLVIIAVVIYRNKTKKRNHAHSSSRHEGFGSCWYKLCKCLVKSDDDHFYGKTDFNGFDRGAYHDLIKPIDGGSGGFTSSNRSQETDFMRDMTPQWPEPEEPATMQTSASEDQEEQEPFLDRQQSTFAALSDVKQINNVHNNSSNSHFNNHHNNPSSKGRGGGDPLIGLRRHSRTSISSSWSSLFNVPTTSNTSTVKTTPSPNRKSIANVESTFTPRKKQ